MRILRDPLSVILTIPAILWALSFHEYCHGLAARLVGDRTAEMRGRLTLNPLAHFDVIGTLMLLFAGFGWAKPVPINTRYFRNPRRDLVIVSLAGIVGNILTAIVTVLFMRYCGEWWYGLTGNIGWEIIIRMVAINMGLAAFNLIPIPPLDGSRVLEAFLPYKYMEYYYFLERYGIFILMILVFTGAIDVIFRPIMSLLLSLLPY